MRKKTIIKTILLQSIFIFLLFPVHGWTQDLSGVWTGYIYNDTTHKNIHYELAVNEPDGKSGGFTHTTFIFDSIKNIGVKSVKIRMKDDHIYIEDNQFIYNNYSIPPPKGVKMYSALVFSQNDSADVLSGMWRTNGTKIYSPVTGTVFLQRKRNEKPRETIIVAKLIDLGLSNQLSFLKPEIALNNTVAINDQPPKRNSELSPGASSNQQIEVSESQAAGKENKSETKQLPPKKEERVTALNDKKSLPDIIKKQANVNAPAEIKSVVEKNLPIKKEEPALELNEKKQPNIISPVKKVAAEIPVQQVKPQPESTPKKEATAPAIAEKKAPTPDATIKKENPGKPVQQLNKKPKQQNVAPVPKDKKEEPVVAMNEKKPAIPVLPKLQNDAKPVQQQKPGDQQNNISPVIQQKNKQESSTIVANQKPPEQPIVKAIQSNVTDAQTPPPAAEISKRKIETIRTVEINQDSLVLSLYDNGTVDGDTVSVLLNGEVIMPRVGLRATAINKTIYLSPEMGDSISVIMYAENLGSIPPNTGLLVIREARRIYEIRFSGDLNKNSKIILIRKKKE